MRPRSSYRPARGFEHMHHHWDAAASAWVVYLMPGEYYVSSGDEVLATVLGSCVSTCMHDPQLGIGGMNHFMLPDDPTNRGGDAALRYGGAAVERLINDLLKRGASRERLEVKVFGGGQVIAGVTDIGQSNVDFVREYLAEEGLAIVASDTGGKIARRLRYHPRTGRAYLKQLSMQDSRIREREQEFRAQLKKAVTIAGEVELF